MEVTFNFLTLSALVLVIFYLGYAIGTGKQDRERIKAYRLKESMKPKVIRK